MYFCRGALVAVSLRGGKSRLKAESPETSKAVIECLAVMNRGVPNSCLGRNMEGSRNDTEFGPIPNREYLYTVIA